jgi:hypothetical protein
MAHSHSHEISPAETARIIAFCTAENARGEAWTSRAQRVLSELAHYTDMVHSKIGGWSMGELDRFVTDYLPGHLGDQELVAAAPESIVVFAKWLKASGGVPSCDVPAIEKRMKKLQGK